MGEFVMSVMNQPNLVYVSLLLSLWLAVTVVYTPGTVVAEVIGTVLFLGTLLVLFQMPTNWLAVLALIAGVACFLTLPFVSLKWANVADFGLVLQVIGGLTLFHSLTVSLPLVITTALLAWVYHRFVLLPVLRAYHTPSEYDKKTALIGTFGRVVKPLDPVGTVLVNGEMWTARSADPLEVDVEIVVNEKVGLELRVEKRKHEHAQA